MGYTRHFVVYNHKFGSVRDKMTGTETLGVFTLEKIKYGI